MDTKFCKENLIVNEDILMRKNFFPKNNKVECR